MKNKNYLVISIIVAILIIVGTFLAIRFRHNLRGLFGKADVPVSDLSFRNQEDHPLVISCGAPGPDGLIQVNARATLTNFGPDDSAGIKVVLHPFTFYKATPGIGEPKFPASIGINVSKGSVDGLTWSIGSLANGETASISFSGTITADIAAFNLTGEVDKDKVDDPNSNPHNWGDTDENDKFSLGCGEIPTGGDTPPIQPPPGNGGPLKTDLSLTKVANPTSVKVNEQTVFTITVLNSGSTTENVKVKDVLPAALSYVNSTATQGNYDQSSNLWSIGTLGTGNSVTLQVSVKVTQAGTFTNTAEVYSSSLPDVDSTPNNNVPTEDDQASASVTATTTPPPPPPPGPKADLSLTKTVDNITPVLNNNVEFTITVKNSGPDATTGVTVKDVLPEGITYVSDTVSKGDFSSASGIWTIGNMAVNETVTLKLKGKTTKLGPITNTAQVAASSLPDPDSTPNNNVPTEDDQASASINVTNNPPPPVDPKADLSLDKTVSNPTPQVGSDIVYSITVKNEGPNAATGVTVKDILPEGVDYVSNSGASDLYNRTTGVWNIGNLAVGASSGLLITAKVKIVGKITNTAEVISSSLPDPDSTPNNHVATEDDQDSVDINSTNVPIIPPPTGGGTPKADISLTKAVDNRTPQVGQNIVYTIVATNSGPDNASGVTVVDALPAGLSYVSSTATRGSFDPSSSLWTINNLAVGDTVNLQITAKVNATGSITNTTEVYSSNLPDPDSTPNNHIATEDDQASVTVEASTTCCVGGGTPTADLSLTKGVDNSNPALGQAFTYIVTVVNSGPNAATGVTVKDVLPAGLNYVGSTTAQGSYTQASGIWDIGTMAVGGSAQLRITVTATQTGIISNIAQVASSSLPDPDSTPNNNNPTEDDQGTVSVTVGQVGGSVQIQQADISLSKTVNNDRPAIGGQIIYTISVTNSGPNDASSVQVKDILPGQLLFVSVNASVGSYDAKTGVWTVGDLEAGDSASLQIKAKVLKIDNIINTAEVIQSNLPDPDSTPGNNNPSEDDQGSVTIVSHGSKQLPATGAGTWAIILIGMMCLAVSLVTHFALRTSRKEQVETPGLTITTFDRYE